jgi:hypothetical protein
MNTPWGQSQTVKHFGPDIFSVSTSSHGGFKVEVHANMKIPFYMRAADGWYEEDCDWAVVAVVFPDLFSYGEYESAKQTLRSWRPEAYERFYGVTLKPGESHKKDEAEFFKAHANDLLVVSAVGDWHTDCPKGFVLVTATKGGGREGAGGERLEFFVPAQEYTLDRGIMPFVIDESKHARRHGRCGVAHRRASADRGHSHRRGEVRRGRDEKPFVDAAGYDRAVIAHHDSERCSPETLRATFKAAALRVRRARRRAREEAKLSAAAGGPLP